MGSNFVSRIFAISSIFFSLSACNQSDVSGGLADSSVLEAEFALDTWPNATTTERNSSIISSKILVADLNGDQIHESIFITQILHSIDKKSSIIRVTSGPRFKEIINFSSQRAHVLKDAIPFALDINKDGLRELFFVSYERDTVYALEFRGRNMKAINVRWRILLPEPLPENFERRLKVVERNGRVGIKVGRFILYEKANRVPAVIDLR